MVLADVIEAIPGWGQMWQYHRNDNINNIKDRNMVAGLPLFKLASLAIKQSAKPVANVIKRGAKESDIFKKYLCYYPGQGKSLINV